MNDDTPLPSRAVRASRKVIRSVLVPVGLGWFFGPVPVHRLPRLVDITVPEFVALWFYGILLLGALSLGVWLWNLLDLMGYPIKGAKGGGSPPCPRCGGSGSL